MIFDTNTEKEAVKVGDIKNNNVSIDTSNIDFIVTILSTNLYSKPIESFIRETVSNAWDSHVEAGVDDPVILELGKDSEGEMFCRIQDFGVGLSPERFDSVYKNIGSSTKRDDNEQIGGFGIGRFSALAYSDVTHITSVYEGKKYSYIMYKDGNTVSIDLLNEGDTDERNGLEVKLELKYGDFNNFARAIKTQLVYFENLYIIDSTRDDLYNSNIDIQSEYNNFSIKKYNNFWVNSLDDNQEVNLVLGKVRYPLRLHSLDKDYTAKVAEYPISLHFEIGELAVTPNREELLYSEKNKRTIEARLDLAIAEVKDLMENQDTVDCKKIGDYLEEIKDNKYLTLLEGPQPVNSHYPPTKVRVKLGKEEKRVTLKGQYFEPKNFEEMYKVIMEYPAIVSPYTVSNGKVKYSGQAFSLNNIRVSFQSMLTGDVSSLKNISKRYLRETLDSSTYFIKRPASLRKFVKDYIKHIKRIIENDVGMTYPRHKHLTHFDGEAFKIIYENVVKNLSKIKHFDDSTVPAKWIADTKAADKAKRGAIKRQGFDWKQNINVHKLRNKDFGGGVMTDSKPFVMKDLSTKFKKLTIYAEPKNEKLRLLFSYLKPQSCPNLIEVAPTKIKLLKDIENFVKLEDFMNTDYALLRNIGTVEYLRREFPDLRQLSTIENLAVISPKLAETIKELNSFVYQYESQTHYRDGDEQSKFIGEIYDICEEKGYFNEKIRGLYLEHKKELDNSTILLDFTHKGTYSSRREIPKKRLNLLVDYLLVRKLIRPSVAAVVKMKQETIFNIEIPVSDESNEN